MKKDIERTPEKLESLSPLASLLYSTGQLSLGLFLHPYRSMQILVRGKVFSPFAFLPSLLFLLFYFIFEKISYFQVIFSEIFLLRFSKQLLLSFLFYWQVILLYLLFRFSRAFWKQSKVSSSSKKS